MYLFREFEIKAGDRTLEVENNRMIRDISVMAVWHM